jgi:hypothetical protein
MIMDDGKGIGEQDIKGTLTLAKSMKGGKNKLGRFGMGLKTAALSLTTNFEIISKTSSGKIVYAQYNINKMKEFQKFFVTLREASDEEKNIFNEKLNYPVSGTIILLKYCDKINAKSNQEFKDSAIGYIGRIYRKFIERGTKFVVKDDVDAVNVKAIDPLMRKHIETKFIADRVEYPITFTDDFRLRTTTIEVSATVLPDGKDVGQHDLKINMSNQGIYLLRQDREIAQALTYTNIWGQRHNSKNRIRFEIVVSPDLDNVLRIDFNKGKGNPTTEFKDQLEKIVSPLLEECVAYLKSLEPEKPKPFPGGAVGGSASGGNSSGTSKPTGTNGGNASPYHGPTGTLYPPKSPEKPKDEILDVYKVTVPKGPIDIGGEKYRILEKVAVFAEKNGSVLELNVVSWGGEEPVIDMRYWNHKTGVSSSGVSMTPKDINNLKHVLSNLKFE